MKFTIITALCLFYAIPSTLLAKPGSAPFKASFYTEIKGSKCLLIDSNEWHNEPMDWYTMECPGFAGYKVIQKGGDARSWYELHYGNHVVNLANDILSKHAFGTFPNIVPTMFEWRVEVQNAQARPYAAIFRVSAQDYNDYTKLKSRLFVVRLNAGFGCVIGVRKTNAEAQALADDLTKPCL